MSGRRKYSDRQRARVYLALKLNEGNIGRSARDTGVPEQTVRDWKREWEKVEPEGLLQALDEVADEMTDDAVRIRNLALVRLEQIIPDCKSVRELTVAIGVLDDKITRAKMVRVKDRPALAEGSQSPSELQANIGDWLVGALSQASVRRTEIVEAEVVDELPVMELPAPTIKE